MAKCEICGNVDRNTLHTAKEMMFGYGDEFQYLECAECGCLQITKVPDDLSKYYPKTYYSFNRQESAKKSRIASFLRRQRVKYCLEGKSPVGFLFSKIRGIPDVYHWFKSAHVGFDSEILDVGCGTGSLLLHLHHEGFSNLTGVDPYIDNDIVYEGSVRIFKKELAEIEGQFDFIMLNHSFEHMPQPLNVLRDLCRLIRQTGCVLIRIPVASSFAWREFGVNWVHLDAPRHIFLHTVTSIRLLANQVGFQVKGIEYDSTASQFWGSIQYFRGIPLMASNSYGCNPRESVFTNEEIMEFQSKAVLLNKANDGDSACFYLRRD